MTEDGGSSLGELAEARGISKDAARRLVKAGKVPAHQTVGGHGPAWCVHPDGDLPERNGGAGDAPGLHHGPATVAMPEDVAALVGMVDRQAAEIRELVGAVAAWQSQAVFLAGRLVDAEQRLAISAPAQSTFLTSTAVQSVEPPSDARLARLRTWAPWLLAVLAIVAVVVLLAWPR